ncbi:flagellar biosynthetic protein FliO [Aquibacillus salsiterrae]|uniref:Flagellar biosynthetic protein FliO n=1 Tax=Aquibacillus salsiterrae TaxID=2950439 RepID=A0A9X3WCI7_9BACI|nr:flagellar biosynthetic protein FliO [Aquibacillus salsiterrae]MDC3416383.1 flagellar biosynthetic protein FliO [Aquibacillus salsiterrae]
MIKQMLVSFILVAALSLSVTTVYATPSVADMFDGKNQEQYEDNSKTQSTESESSGEAVENLPSTNLGVDLIKLVAALGFVLGLIYLLLKFLNQKNKLVQQNRTLENLGGISLGTNKSLQVVKIGSRLYVIGVGDNVELLSEITDEETIQQLLGRDEPNDRTASSLFRSLLMKQNGKANKTKEQTNSFSTVFKSEMDRLVDGRKKLTKRLAEKDDDDE